MNEIRAHEAPQGAQLIARAADILRAVPRGAPDGRRLRDLAASTGLTEPTIHRILKALIHERFVVQDGTTRRYRLGPLAYELGLAAHAHSALIERCLPHVRALAVETGDSIFLAIRSGVETVCLARADGAYPIKATIAEVGERRLLGVGTGGVALLASLSDGEIDEVLSSAVFACVDPPVDELRSRVAFTRSHGYADISDKPLPGVRGIAVVVPGVDGPPMVSLSVAAVQARLTDAHLVQVLPMLKAAAARIAVEIG